MTQNLQVFKLQDVYILKKDRHSKFFYTTSDSVSIPAFNFSAMIKYMVFRGLLSVKVLEEIVDEFYNASN